MLCLDTNILAYAEGVNDSARQTAALQLMDRLPEDTVIPVQALGELHRVLTGKLRLPADQARQRVLSWQDGFVTRGTTAQAFLAALDLAADHRLSIWDSLILAVAADAGCRVLLSEDLLAGFTWRGLTVINPFAQPEHPLLAARLGPGS